MTPKAVCFDLDNTLYAYAPAHAAGLQASWELARGLDLYPDAPAHDAAYAAARGLVHGRLGDTAASHNRLLYYQAMIEALRGRSDTDLALALYRTYWHGYFTAMSARLDPGAQPLLERLRGLELRSALVTDMTAELQFDKLRHLGLAGLFDAVVTSEEAGADKPDPAPLRLALEKLKVPPVKAVMVGDSPERDGGAARAVGAAFVWMAPADAEWPAGLPAPDGRVADCAALTRWLGVA